MRLTVLMCQHLAFWPVRVVGKSVGKGGIVHRVSVDLDPQPALDFLRELEGQPDREHQLAFLQDRADLELIQLVASFAALAVRATRIAEDLSIYLLGSRNIVLAPGRFYTSDEPSDAAKLARLLRDLDKSGPV